MRQLLIMVIKHPNLGTNVMNSKRTVLRAAYEFSITKKLVWAQHMTAGFSDEMVIWKEIYHAQCYRSLLIYCWSFRFSLEQGWEKRFFMTFLYEYSVTGITPGHNGLLHCHRRVHCLFYPSSLKSSIAFSRHANLGSNISSHLKASIKETTNLIKHKSL